MSPCRFDSVVHSCGHETLQHREGPHPSCYATHTRDFCERYATDTTLCVQNLCGDTACGSKAVNANAVTKAVNLLRERLVESEKKIKELTDSVSAVMITRPQPLDHACRCIHKVYSNLAMLRPYVDSTTDFVLTDNHRKVFSDAFRIVIGHLDTIPNCIRDAERQLRQTGWKPNVDEPATARLGSSPPCATTSLGIDTSSPLTGRSSLPSANVPISAATDASKPTTSSATSPSVHHSPIDDAQRSGVATTPADDGGVKLQVQLVSDLTSKATSQNNDSCVENTPHFLDDEMDDDNWYAWRWAGTDEEKELAIKHKPLMLEMKTIRMSAILAEAKRREGLPKTRVTMNSQSKSFTPAPRLDPHGAAATSAQIHTQANNANGTVSFADAAKIFTPQPTYGHHLGTVPAASAFLRQQNMSSSPASLTHGMPPAYARYTQTPSFLDGAVEQQNMQRAMTSLGYQPHAGDVGAAGFPVGSHFTPNGVFIPFSSTSQGYNTTVNSGLNPSADLPKVPSVWESIYGTPFNTAFSNAALTDVEAAALAMAYRKASAFGAAHQSDQAFAQHRARSLLSQDPYTAKVCNRCNKIFPNLRDMYQHNQLCQAQKCDGCGFVCETGVAFFDHRRSCVYTEFKVRVSSEPEA